MKSIYFLIIFLSISFFSYGQSNWAAVESTTNNTPVDKAPSAYCINGTMVELSSDNSQIEIRAEDFNMGSFDDYEIVDFLIESPSRGPEQSAPPKTASPFQVFNCKDVGTQSVDLWVSDAFGNWDYCSTYVIINDFQNKCLEEKKENEVVEIENKTEVENEELNFEFRKEKIDHLKIHTNTPNPFFESTLIKFELPQATSLSFTIQDISGRNIKSLEVQMESGYNEIQINKEELNGPGIYFYIVKTKNYRVSEKMILLKN